jgi:hypothetical protein
MLVNNGTVLTSKTETSTTASWEPDASGESDEETCHDIYTQLANKLPWKDLYKLDKRLVKQVSELSMASKASS